MSFRYDLKMQSERVGELVLRIECLKDLNQTIDDLFGELERSGNAALLEELCPYFGTIWPSARALSETIWEKRDQFSGKRVMELGCGLALPSLVAAKLGASVVATDFHPEVPRFLERNLALNQVGAISYERIDWAQGFPELGAFDWIIGSDVLYERQHSLLLAQVVGHYLQIGAREGKKARALIADPARPYLQGFVDEMTRLRVQSQSFVRSAFDVPQPKEIFLLEFFS